MLIILATISIPLSSLNTNVPVSKGKSFRYIEQITTESFCFVPIFLYILCSTINYLDERSESSEIILLSINLLLFIGIKNVSSQSLKTQGKSLLSEHLPVILLYA
jgi:hypothetical protein